MMDEKRQTSAGFTIEDVVSIQVSLVETGNVHTLFMESDTDRLAAAVNLLEQCEYTDEFNCPIAMAIVSLNDL